MTNLGELGRNFELQYGVLPDFVARGPGRVNIIGEHTDYNLGFVLPCALPLDVAVAAGYRPDGLISVWSPKFKSGCVFDPRSIPLGKTDWTKYVLGIASVLVQDKGLSLPGLNMVVSGDVPEGSGLSSSAALEVACCRAFLYAARQPMSGTEVAKICQKAEHVGAKVQCGIMDMFISANAAHSHALFLDCRDLSYQNVPLDLRSAGLCLVVADTGKRRALDEGIYNTRVEECGAAVEALRSALPSITSLRDVSPDQLFMPAVDMDSTVYQRAAHVVLENERVTSAVAALYEGDFKRLGALMCDSHESLRDKYAATGPHLDAMVEESMAYPGVLGSRMTGAGFGGCTVSLVAAENVSGFCDVVGRRYTERTELLPTFYVVEEAMGGAEVMSF